MIRNLRNFLFDQQLGLRNVRRIELRVDSQVALQFSEDRRGFSSETDHGSDNDVESDIKNVLGNLWIRNFGLTGVREAYELSQRREFTIWDQNVVVGEIDKFDFSSNEVIKLPVECGIELLTVLEKDQFVVLRAFVSTDQTN